jgi:hypothetical protein
MVISSVAGYILECLRADYATAEDVLPWGDGQFWGITYDTHELLDSLDLGCDDAVLSALVEEIDEGQAWCDRDINGKPGEMLADGWTYFELAVKHTARFFLSNVGRNDNNPSAPEPLHTLDLLVKFVEQHRLFDTMSSGTVLYRVRETAIDDDVPSRPRDFGPPPAERATQSNRMNPPGIAALYISLDRTTCLNEVPPRDGYRRFVGSLVSQRDIKLVDLTRIPHPPPLLCGHDPEERHSLQFLEAFGSMIAQPIARDDRVHLDYVPTQVVSEFLMHAFRKHGIVGINFASAKALGANVVLFSGPECIVAEPGAMHFRENEALFRLLESEEIVEGGDT